MNAGNHKLKILLVNKFYRRGGGDCIHFLALEKLLRDHGHEVAVLTMHHPDNLPLPPGSFEVPQVSIDGSIIAKVNAASRILGGYGVRSAVKTAITSFCPDVVHLHNIHSYLSPAVAQVAKESGIPVAWTLHDYKLICGAYSCLQNGIPCTECISSPASILRHRCMKNSAAASMLAFAEARKWNIRKLERLTDIFICPSGFMRDKMISGGFAPGRLSVLHNFLSYMPKVEEKPLHRSGVCYIGRLSPEKGVEYLLEAAQKGGWKLTVAGSGPLENDLKRRFGAAGNITFAGQLSAQDVASLLARSAISVIPSVCYENNPLAVIESLCAGTPVAGADIGGIPELIDSKNGILFAPRSSDAIVTAVNEILSSKWDYDDIAATARRRFAPENYYSALFDIYNSLTLT